MNRILIFVAIALSLNACFKDPPAVKLPPITQRGANTLGFLLNNAPWIPRGQDNKPNPRCIYSIGLNGLPYLTLEAIQVDASGYSGDFFILIDSLTGPGTYTFYTNKADVSFLSKVYSNACELMPEDTTSFKSGKVIVTKLDIPNHIVSGTFNVTWKTSGCDTMKITDGRFDMYL